jgi:hypothetical protein
LKQLYRTSIEQETLRHCGRYGTDILDQGIRKMKLGRLLQDDILIDTKAPRNLYGDRHAQSGAADDNIGFRLREMTGKGFADEISEPDPHIDYHQQCDRTPLAQPDDRQAEIFARNLYLIGLRSLKIHHCGLFGTLFAFKFSS